MSTLEVLGQPFEVLWQSQNRRLLSNREKCLELISFSSVAWKDDEELRRGLPVEIVECWIVNPDFERGNFVESEHWSEDGILPPEARGLPVEPEASLQAVQDFSKVVTRQMHVLEIVKEVFRGGRDKPDPHSISRFTPGIKALKATFGNGEVSYLRGVIERDVPDEALVKFKLQDAALIQAESQKDIQAWRTDPLACGPEAWKDCVRTLIAVGCKAHVAYALIEYASGATLELCAKGAEVSAKTLKRALIKARTTAYAPFFHRSKSQRLAARSKTVTATQLAELKGRLIERLKDDPDFLKEYLGKIDAEEPGSQWGTTVDRLT